MPTPSDAQRVAQAIADLAHAVEDAAAKAGAALWIAQAAAQYIVSDAVIMRAGDTAESWADAAYTRLWQASIKLRGLDGDVALMLEGVERDWLEAYRAATILGDVPSMSFIRTTRGAWSTGMRGLTTEAQRLVGQAAADLRGGDIDLPEAVRQAARGIVAGGSHVLTDISGRRWQPASYAESIVRQAAQRAHTSASLAAAADLGTPYIVVSDHHRECPRCRPWESRILRTDGVTDEHASATLGEARAAGLQHNNCRHQVYPWWAGLDDKPAPGRGDDELYRASQQQRSIERGSRTAKLNLDIEQRIDPTSWQTARAAQTVRSRQADMRAHLDQHPRLRRSSWREQVLPGQR